MTNHNLQKRSAECGIQYKNKYQKSRSSVGEMGSIWQSVSLFSVSLVMVVILYHITTGDASEPQTLNTNEIKLNSEIILTSKLNPLPIQPVLAQTTAPVLQKGTEISVNGRKFPVAWMQWNEEGTTRIGISDTGVMNILGLHFLSTKDPNLQPVHWFSADPNQPIQLKAKFIAPYRYLDVTDILQTANTKVQDIGNTLNLTVPLAQIQNIRQGNQDWGKRIVLDLDRPTFWLVSEAKDQGAVILPGISSPSLVNRYQPTTTGGSQGERTNLDEDDLGSSNNFQINSQLFSLVTEKNLTKLLINLPTANGLRVYSLNNPPRLVIDVRPDDQVEREIAWTSGMIWRQKRITVQGDVFPVTWLEVDLKSAKLAVKPITGNPNTLEGTDAIVNTARSNQAVAAINGGFFNRNNKLPLGAIRREQKWLSGPILGRGAIAWNQQGMVKMGRLQLKETVITNRGKQLSVLFLNSGYVEAGMARYTPEWGPIYVPLSDDEMIITVQDNRVTEQRRGGKAGQNSIAIPKNGYLLTIRKNGVSAADLGVGTEVKLDSVTIPSEFANYPHILGAGPLLVLNKQIVVDAVSEKFSKGFQQQKASRSAIAINQQGQLMMVAVHNRIGGSGASLKELAQIMQNLGAVDALNLDGGSSTSLALGGQLIDRSPVTAAKVHNGLGVFVAP
jgi:exopolysaccharide biosynthesis protein